MKCPNCGADVPDGDVPFCPHCGQNLAGRRSKRKLRFVLMDVQDDRRFRHLASAAVITVVIVAVLAVLLAVGGTDEQPPATTTEGPSDDAIIISDTAYIELGGDFSDGILSAAMSGGELTIRLSSERASGYDSFDWILRDELDNSALYNTKETPDITWISPSVGMYSVTVICHSSATGDQAVYVGTIDYRGGAHIQYSFDYDGRGFTVYADITYEEYSQAKSEAEGRNTDSADAAVGFIRTDGAVQLLAGRLQSAFAEAYPGASTTGADFAGFVIAFVQGCIGTGTDAFLNGTAVYWAYPAETLYRGVGDSGDQAVLAASLLEACGYDAGIALIHGQSFVATYVQGYSGPSNVPDGYHTVRVQSDGRQYILTELSEGYVPLGCIPDEYGYSGGRFTYYGQQSSDDSGMAVAQSL